MAVKILKEPEDFKLRTSDIWGQPDRLLDNDDASLEQEQIHDGDTLWLESGNVPPHSLIFFFPFSCLCSSLIFVCCCCVCLE
jgi:hypothetical protein